VVEVLALCVKYLPPRTWPGARLRATRECCGKRCARASHGIHSFLQGAGYV